MFVKEKSVAEVSRKKEKKEKPAKAPKTEQHAKIEDFAGTGDLAKRPAVVVNGDALTMALGIGDVGRMKISTRESAR